MTTFEQKPTQPDAEAPVTGPNPLRASRDRAVDLTRAACLVVVVGLHVMMAGITVDTDRIEQAMSGIDPTNPAAMQEILSSGVFRAEETPEQKQALASLETLLALVEGWVQVVVAEAAGDRLEAFGQLQEAIVRRRAAGGPAERTFATLVGLEMRPRKLREAERLWRALGEARGQQGRDALWAHPDLLPTPEDLERSDEFIAATDPAMIEDLASAFESLTSGGEVSGSDGPGEREESAGEQSDGGEGGSGRTDRGDS